MQIRNHSTLALFTLGILGSIVRVVYALKFELHLLSPDQLAWEYSLQELLTTQSLSYDRLIHYPHEGGTILVSLLALLFKPFFPNHSLVVCALFIDFVSRLIQLAIVRKIFGVKNMLLYGLWSVFALPILIQWAGINFGLHALSSIFPFLFLFLLYRDHTTRNAYIYDGIFLGLMGWFIYSNFLFVPLYLIYLLLKRPAWDRIVGFIVPFGFVLLCHSLVRAHFSPGFLLSTYDATSIRGEEFNLLDINSYQYLLDVWIDPFRKSSLLESPFIPQKELLQWTWLATIFGGLLLFIRFAVKNRTNQWLLLTLCFPILYVSLYSTSPFYLKPESTPSYVLSRHFTYIYPFLTALCIIGYSQTKKTTVLTLPLFILSLLGFHHIMGKEKIDVVLFRPTGWVLANKFGHDPNRVLQIVDMADTAHQQEILIGVGWGTSSALLSSHSANTDYAEDLSQLTTLLQQYPKEKQDQILEGIYFSFSPKVNPTIDSTIYYSFIRQPNLVQE